MAAHIRLADRGATQTSLPIVIDGLSYHADEYTQLLIFCSNGDKKYAVGGGGAASTSFYTTPVEFTGLRPGATYGFRVEAIWRAGTRMVPIPNNGTLTYFDTLPASVFVPAMPTVSVVSVNGRQVTWRVRANDHTEYIQVENDWGGYGDTAWVDTGNTHDFTYTLPANDARYAIRARAWNIGYGYGSYSGWSYAMTAKITVGVVTNLARSLVTTSGFKLSWSAASQAAGYQVAYRVRGGSSWTTRNTTATEYTITGLDVGTYYEYRVRGYNGSIYGSWTSTGEVRTEKEKPTKLNWPTFTKDTPVNTLSASNWNDLMSKINAWRDYHGHTAGTVTSVRKDDVIRAALYNQAVSNMSVLSVRPRPSNVGVTSTITASRINALGVAIDSL